MRDRQGKRLRPASMVLVGGLVACVLALPGVAGAAPADASVSTAPAPAAPPTGRGGSTLSPRLEELSARATSRTSDAGQARIAELPSGGPGSLLRGPDGSLRVNVRLSAVTADARGRLERAGARVVAVSEADRLVTVSVEPASLDALRGVAGVEWAEEVLTPFVGSGARPASRGQAATSASCASRVVSEGDSQLLAATARSTYGVDGTGVPVGVLSDSYDNLGGAATDVTNGELPGPANPCGRTTAVTVQADEASGGSDEGRGMAQLVHDVAPGSPLTFATAFNSDVDFANQIRTLATNGNKVIVDDISYFNEPIYQDGIIAKAVNDVTAAGVTYWSSAGNGTLTIGGKSVASYETGAYRPIPCPATVSAAPYSDTDCHDFDPGAGTDNGNTFTIANTRQVLLKLGYDQPQYGVTTDLDLFLLDAGTGAVVASAVVDNVNASKQAYELLSYTNNTGAAKTYKVVVGRFGTGPVTRFKTIHLNTGGISAVQWNTNAGGDVMGPSTYGHNADRVAGSIAAVPYNNSNTVESYSSQGPATYCWAPVSGTSPAASLGGCQTKNLDVAATDGAANSFFGQLSGSTWRFYGTSAAAPHAAAVGALQLQARPCRTPAEVLAAQRSSGRAVGSFGVASIGSGLLDAGAAIANLTACPTAPTAPGAPTAVSAVPGDAQASVTWTAPASDGGSAVTGYRVTPYIGAAAQASQTFNSTATTQAVTGLANGTAYTFKVAAKNAVGTGADSAASAAVTPTAAPTAPGPPTGVSAVAADGAASVSWTAPASDGGSAVTGYRVTPYIGAAAQTPQVFDSTATTQVATGLTNGTAYTFKVAAKNSVGTGADSTASAAVTPTAPATAPGAPTGVSGTPGDGKVTLSWTAPASNGGSAVTGYRVTPSIGGVAQAPQAFSSTATTQPVTGLTNGTAYTFTVAATNAVGTGAESAASAAVTPRTVPGAPTAVSGTPGDTKVTVSWTAPASNGGSAVTGYRVTPYVGATAQAATNFGTTATTQVVTGLANGTAYTFKVAATNVAGTGADSVSSSAVTPRTAWAPFASWGALVDRLYADLLGRAPTATERSDWIDALTAGDVTPGGVVAALRTDPDHLGNVDPVTRLYRAYFLRIPDQGGLTYWIARRRAGRTLASISSTFAGSSEFTNRYGTLGNKAFVELVYQNVLGRPGDADGIAFWTKQLDTGRRTRGLVMIGFSESNEFKRTSASETTASVLPILLLGRKPTASEFAAAVSGLDALTETTTSLAGAILASDEYATHITG